MWALTGVKKDNHVSWGGFQRTWWVWSIFFPKTCYTQIVEITAEAVRFQHVNGNEDLVADITSKNLENCT